MNDDEQFTFLCLHLTEPNTNFPFNCSILVHCSLFHILPIFKTNTRCSFISHSLLAFITLTLSLSHSHALSQARLYALSHARLYALRYSHFHSLTLVLSALIYHLFPSHSLQLCLIRFSHAGY